MGMEAALSSSNIKRQRRYQHKSQTFIALHPYLKAVRNVHESKSLIVHFFCWHNLINENWLYHWRTQLHFSEWPPTSLITSKAIFKITWKQFLYRYHLVLQYRQIITEPLHDILQKIVVTSRMTVSTFSASFDGLESGTSTTAPFGINISTHLKNERQSKTVSFQPRLRIH